MRAYHYHTERIIELEEELLKASDLNAELLEVCQNLLPRAASWLEDLHDNVFDGDDGHPDIVRAQKAIAKAEASVHKDN